MCRCCQSCWEDFYWSCIEEKFCYDESIAHYDPDEDEYITEKKTGNGFLNSDTIENNNAPICRQPSRLQRNCSTVSSKCHEDELRREIQTNVPMLAPEVLAVFANSQIFHEHSPTKQLVKSPPLVKFALDTTPIDITSKSREDHSDRLLKRLEAPSYKLSTDSVDGTPKTRIIPAIIEEEDCDEVVLRPPNEKEISESNSFKGSSVAINKNLQAIAPYFSFRPASENDIFTISSSSYNQISSTPEVPAISYNNLPKHYLETPTIREYCESVSLYSIQTAGIQTSEQDYSMPRYYRKSELFLQHSADNVGARSNTVLETTSSSSSFSTTPKRTENSKRLQNIRSALPPLMIVGGGSTSSVREKDHKDRDKDSKHKSNKKDNIRI